MGYDKGGFISDELDSNVIYPITEPNLQNLSNINELKNETACGNCKIKNFVFCNFRNEECYNFLQYKRDIGIESSEKCVLVKMKSFKGFYDNEAIVFHIKSYNRQFRELTENTQFRNCDFEKLKQDTEIKLIHVQAGEKNLFVLTGKISVLNIETLLSRVSYVCCKMKIETLHIIDFNMLEISYTLLCRIFQNNYIKLMGYSENLYEAANVRRVLQHGRDVQATLHEKIDFNTQLNVIVDCKETKAKMLELCIALNKSENGLKPLWSKSTHDIGLFRQRGDPGYPIKFKFPIKPEMMNKPPLSIKTGFISDRLLGPAKQMLNALEEAKIVVRAFSKYNARTHFILKPPKEITIAEWIAKGHKAEDFIAGTLDDKGTLTVRMVHHFLDLNERTINAPIYQPSTSQQLRKISPAIKYLSVIDVTACFFSLLIDKESSEMTGFDSGIQRFQRYKYLRVPMGAAVSKTLADVSLLYAISDLGNYLIYSDNIIIISEGKNQHFEHVKNILTRLREHGFKCKLSKANFFITNMVRLYGHVLDLTTGTISPDKDKLEALRSKGVPHTRKELKSFLGGLQFFGQLLPLAGDTLAVLHQATRGKTFVWTEKQQKAYEAIIMLLSKEGVIFVYRGDDDKAYRVAIDTSEFHTSYVVFQLDENQDSRPIQYGMKTWTESFANHIPEYRELLGIVFTLQALESEYEHKKHPLIVYTDNLPLCLMNISSRISRKIARIKLFLESLNWITICWSPGSSEIIALPDYFSRQREDKPKKLKKPGHDEKELSEKISEKIDTSKLYSGPKSSFLIDSLIELSPSELDEIKNHTASLDDANNLVFIKHVDSKKRPHVDSKKGSLSQISKVKLKVTNNEAEQQIIDLQVKKDKSQEKTTPISRQKKVKVSVQNKIENMSDLKHMNIEDVAQSEYSKGNKSYEQNYVDILDYPNLISAKSSNFIPTENRRQLSGKGSLQRWYNNFIKRAQYLDLRKLREALELDPYWKQIMDICLKQTKYIRGDKIYFICDEILVVKTKLSEHNLNYRICLPSALAYDTILMAHRQLLHCHGHKLENHLKVYFEIRNLHNLVSHITRECFICGMTKPQEAGGTRPPMIKRMMSVNRKNTVWFVDELQLVDKNTGREIAGFSKLLVAIDGFTHFIVIEPLSEQVTSETFIRFIQERIHQVFGPCQALVTDNDAKLSSRLVQAACSFLNIYKLESLPYSPRANLAELANKLLLAGLRNETMSLYLNPKYFHILLHNIVYLINSLVFTDSKDISPYVLMFAQTPRQDILQIYATGVDEILDKNE